MINKKICYAKEVGLKKGVEIISNYLWCVLKAAMGEADEM